MCKKKPTGKAHSCQLRLKSVVRFAACERSSLFVIDIRMPFEDDQTAFPLDKSDEIGNAKLYKIKGEKLTVKRAADKK